MRIEQQLTASVPLEQAGERIDKVLATLFPAHSRSAIQKWLKQGLVLLDDEVPRQRDRVTGGEQIELLVPAVTAVEWRPQKLDLEIVFEDADVMVINKPAGLVVHPGAGNPEGTLVNGLLALDQDLQRLPRAGIVHRLDKGTSGLLVVARSERARQSLIEQLASRQLKRTYLAIACGQMIAGGVVDQPIGRDPKDRRRMTVSKKGKPAITHYRVEEKFRAHTLVRADLETGRTHQIRVHMRFVGFPLLGDPVYGERLKIPPGCSAPLADALRRLHRQALHAHRLGLEHPVTGESMHWQADLPDDLDNLVTLLRQDRDRT